MATNGPGADILTFPSVATDADYCELVISASQMRELVASGRDLVFRAPCDLESVKIKGRKSPVPAARKGRSV